MAAFETIQPYVEQLFDDSDVHRSTCREQPRTCAGRELA
jgi:hypothetical protein